MTLLSNLSGANQLQELTHTEEVKSLVFIDERNTDSSSR